MSETAYSNSHMHGTLHVNTCIAIMALALLFGCAAVNTVQTTAPSAESNVCNADTDSFCIESNQQKAARLNQQGVEFGSRQDYDLALKSFKQAIALDRFNPEYH